MTRPPADLDHLVLAAPDLDGGRAWVEDRLGVEPAPGGSHPGVGTRNALLSLGPRSYLECIGPDPDQPEPSRPPPFGMDELEAPRLVTWVVRRDGLDEATGRWRERGVDAGDASRWSRRRSDGALLEWELTDPFLDRLGGVVPFFIDWLDSEHPATTAPHGCALAELRLRHPEPEEVRRVLEVLELEVPVEFAAEPGLEAVLDTPRGRRTLR